MNDKLEKALDNVELSYKELTEIADDTLTPLFKDADVLVDEINNNINNLTIDQIRDYILKLQLNAYSLSEIKEKSQVKADLANTIQKQNFAVSFNSIEGSAAVKDKKAQVETVNETVAEVLYNLMANLIKTKLDQLHRLVNVLTSILMSRMSEAKLMNLGAAEDVNSYKTKKQLLMEGE